MRSKVATVLVAVTVSVLTDVCRIVVYAYFIHALWLWGWIDLSWLKEVLR